MKITVSFDTSDLKTIAELRGMLDLYDPKPQSVPADTLPLPPLADPLETLATHDASVDLPPPPPPPAASDTPVALPPPGPDEERDIEGCVWDSEVHASSKKKLKDGTWRKKRGAKPAQPPLVAGPQMGLHLPPDAPAPPPPPDAPAPPPPPAVVASQTPAPPAAPGSVGGTAPPLAPTVATTWDTVVSELAARNPKYSSDQIRGVLATAGIDVVTLFNNPAQYGTAVATLSAACPM